MLTEAGCQFRRERLWERLPDDLQWAVIADPRSVLYFSAFWVQPLSFSTGERAVLFLDREGPAILCGDNFATRCPAGEFFVDDVVAHDWYDHVHSVENRDHALFAALKSIANRIGKRPGVVETEWLPCGACEALGTGVVQTVSLGTIVRELRRSKHEDEIALMRTCMAAGDAGHARAREIIAEGVLDLDVYREIQSAAVANAGKPAIVYGDFRVSSATNPKAGGLPVGETIGESDLFIADYTVMLQGYRSDFTNTYAPAAPSAEQSLLFDCCTAAMSAAEKLIKAGTPAAELYAAASREIEKAGHGPLSHHAGHGLGIGHPEPPILVPQSDDVLVAGDVITIEPGIYVEGVAGMRIEHNYLVTQDGFERLSNHTISLT